MRKTLKSHRFDAKCNWNHKYRTLAGNKNDEEETRTLEFISYSSLLILCLNENRQFLFSIEQGKQKDKGERKKKESRKQSNYVYDGRY